MSEFQMFKDNRKGRANCWDQITFRENRYFSGRFDAGMLERNSPAAKFAATSPSTSKTAGAKLTPADYSRIGRSPQPFGWQAPKTLQAFFSSGGFTVINAR